MKHAILIIKRIDEAIIVDGLVKLTEQPLLQELCTQKTKNPVAVELKVEGLRVKLQCDNGNIIILTS